MAINLDKYAWYIFRHGRKAHLVEIPAREHYAICGKVGIPTGIIETISGHITIPKDFLPRLLCRKCISEILPSKNGSFLLQ